MLTLPLLGGVRAIPSSENAAPFLPSALGQFVVPQAPDRYTAVDQAVWRFVLLQLQSELKHTAVSGFTAGAARLGIRPSNIVSIEEMDECLQQVGWRAVCVNGFLPPRIFQAFQCLRVLPIAAGIRSPAQLPYTPAPDILHEAVGHAPLLLTPLFAKYIQKIGQVAALAFSAPADSGVDEAVRTLSDLEEKSEPDPPSLRFARQLLEQAKSGGGPTSEAVQLARLFWWTAEYGLVGKLTDYQLFGAGLLSSLGESRSCNLPEIEKRTLTADCTDIGFDITRPQPQLFVARNFEHLFEVLDEVQTRLAHTQGGDKALFAALRSQQTVSLSTASGLRCVGKVQTIAGVNPTVAIALQQNCGLALGEQPVGHLKEPIVLPWGPLLTPNPSFDAQGRKRFEFASGLVAVGRPLSTEGNHPWYCPLVDFQLGYPNQPPLARASQYPLLLVGALTTARPASPQDLSAPSSHLEQDSAKHAPASQVPVLPTAGRLYRRVRNLSPHACASYFRALRANLRHHHPHDWLLHWSLLERVQQYSHGAQVAQMLRADLQTLELSHGGEYPIATGLKYLQAIYVRGTTKR